MKTTRRVQFEMPQRSFDRMNELQEKIEASSHAEVVRRALQLYEALIEESEMGNEICVRSNEDGEIIYRPIF